MLNDVCLNGVAAYLQNIFIRDRECHRYTRRCALFSTHDLVRIRFKASDDELWRWLKKLQYWERDIWIIPIHRRRECHWVLAVVFHQRAEIAFYDSLAGKRLWHQDVKVWL